MLLPRLKAIQSWSPNDPRLDLCRKLFPAEGQAGLTHLQGAQLELIRFELSVVLPLRPNKFYHGEAAFTTLATIRQNHLARKGRRRRP